MKPRTYNRTTHGRSIGVARLACAGAILETMGRRRKRVMARNAHILRFAVRHAATASFAYF
ncbi:MAG: hypothetical protein WCA37_10800, partial [Terracidiphilus sp.]